MFQLSWIDSGLLFLFRFDEYVCVSIGEPSRTSLGGVSEGIKEVIGEGLRLDQALENGVPIEVSKLST